MSENNKLLHIKIVTPDGIRTDEDKIAECVEFTCSSIRMQAKDNEKSCGGGSFGVRYGHTNALAALDYGVLEAYCDDNLVRKYRIHGGFAKITRDSVTVLTDGVELIN